MDKELQNAKKKLEQARTNNLVNRITNKVVESTSNVTRIVTENLELFKHEIVEATDSSIKQSNTELVEKILKIQPSLDDLKQDIEEVKKKRPTFSLSPELRKELRGEDGNDGVKGDKGEPGRNGIDGLPGRDGADGKDGLDGRDGKDGRDGRDGGPDTPGQIVDKLESLKGDDKKRFQNLLSRLVESGVSVYESVVGGLNNLNDVVISNASEYDILQYVSGKWSNRNFIISTGSDSTNNPSEFGDGTNALQISADSGGVEIESKNNNRIRISEQIRFDSNGFDINKAPIVLRNVEENDSPGAKGSIIEWQQYFTAGDKMVGIATKAYLDWVRGGSVGDRPEFNIATAGHKDVGWIMAHYDSPSSTGEDIHQHMNLETVKADFSTLVTRFQISYGEDIANIGFPNSEVTFYNDKKIYFSNTEDIYWQFISSDDELELIPNGRVIRIGDHGEDVEIELAGQNGSETGGRIRFSESSGSSSNGMSIVYNSSNNRLKLIDDANDATRLIIERGGDMDMIGKELRGVGNLRVGGANDSSTLNLNGSLAVSIDTITSSTLALDDSYYTILCDTSSNAITINLPAAGGCSGRMYNIKVVDNTNSVTVDANGSETIDGESTQVMTQQYSTMTIQSNGSNWYIL
jgi:hypothetical protein